MHHGILDEALEVLSGTDPEDASAEARGRRAHARVLAMIEMARQAEASQREQRIANLLLLAQLDKKDAGPALKEARRLMAEDDAGRAPGIRRVA
ncbi:hypothetical protein ACQ3I4_13000 [Zafaria sp. Z1313]|uniref:hypothetical protein n=1 Tax=unclassified Zafaria TaxID=2828765 RepID=UPI002E7A985D|nr:hypothetical protein [Zafaria sp. J156]MEE1622405.1 hypothetical protein [Zafaria sp. J156]